MKWINQNMPIRNVLLFLASFHVAVLLPAFNLHAEQESVPSEAKPGIDSGQEPSEQELLKDLLAVLEEHTEIATKTKLNVDYVPGMVTVLGGEDMKSRGVHTVQEALNLVPGITTSMSGPMKEQITVRGVSKQLSGKIKFLLNGMQTNDSTMGEPFYIYAIPMDMVDRIEVIRGPGSAVYGEFAYLGVVNIITKTKGNQVYGQYGSFKSHMAGGVFSYDPPQEEFGFSLALSGWDSRGGDVESGLDKDLSGPPFFTPQFSHLYAPGEVNERLSHRSSVLSAHYKQSSLVAQYVGRGDGQRFGHNDVLPPEEDRLALESSTWLVEARQKIDFDKTLQANLKLGMFRDRFDMDRGFMWPEAMTRALPFLPNTITKAIDEDKYYGALGLEWRGWNRHTLSAETNYSESRAEDSSGNEMSRDIIGLSLQDQISVMEPLDVTLGVRYDHYDQIGSTLTPRLSAVYRLSPNHILKAQYGEAFRPPSYMELNPDSQPVNGNPDNSPETIRTSEIGYIYRDHLKVGRVTLFHSQLEDVIDLVADQGGPRQYRNTQNATLNGMELELEQRLSEEWKLNTNLSYTQTNDHDSDKELAGATHWLANIGVVFSPESDYVLSLQDRYVGSRFREPGDGRDNLDGFNTLDITGTIYNFSTKGLTLRSGVKNIFDEDVVQPALINTYIHDYPRPGRAWWLNLSYDF